MKTPNLLLLALAAALSSPAAASDLPHRCDAGWLSRTSAIVGQGGTPNVEKPFVSEALDGGTRVVIDLGSDAFPCDGALKHFLAVQAPAGGDAVMDPKTHQPVGGLTWKWSDEGLRDAWKKGLDQQVRILGAADDLYADVDARAKAALDAADAAADAAVKLGVVARKDGAGLDKLKADGYTGAAFAGLKAYTLEAGPASATSDVAQWKASLSSLLKDPPAPKAQAGKPAPKPGAPVLGPAVLAFRSAVYDLANEVAGAAATRNRLAKRGVDAAAAKDIGLKTGAGAMWVMIAMRATKGGAPHYDAKYLVDDKTFGEALAYLTDPKIAAGDDESVHAGAALDRLDFGVRNLLASRAAAVDAAVAAARKVVGAGSVKAALAGADRDEKARHPDFTKPTADLGAETLAKLGQMKDYSDLNALFEARSKAAAADPNSPSAKWMASPAGREAKAKLEAMRADAKGTSVTGDKLTYTIGGTARTAPIRVPAVTDAGYRGAIEQSVVSSILKGHGLSAELSAALAAFRNDPAAPPLTPDQAAVGDKLPPKDGPPAPAASAWDTIAKATPAPGFFSSYQGRIQKYQDEMRQKYADEADQDRRNRAAAQAAADKARKDARRKCEDDKRELGRRPADPLWKPAVAAKWRSDLLAAREAKCQGEIDQAAADAVKPFKLQDPKVFSDANKAAVAQADALVKQAYVDGILASIGELRKEYRDEKSDRGRKAAGESGFYTYYGKHLDLVDGYFKKTWEDKKDESVGACRDLLWHPAKGDIEMEFKDPTRDNVDDRCVHVGLILHLKSYIGTGDKAD